MSDSLTTAEAAAYAGVSPRTVQRAIARGELVARKTGANTAGWLIDPRNLDAWMKGREG